MTNPRFVGARLRKGMDEDLVEATQSMDASSKSELIRQGLRLALGIRTEKVIEVKVRPVVATPKIWRPSK